MGEDNQGASNVFSKACQWYGTKVTAVNTALSLGLSKLSAFVFRRTKLTAILSILFLLICSVGWLRFKIVTDGDKLWSPQNSKAMKDGNYMKANFGTVRDSSMLIISAKSANGNVISLETTWEIFKLDQKIQALKISKGGKEYGFSDICYKNENGACRQNGYLNFWNMSFPQYLKSVGGSETNPSAGNLTKLMRDVNALQFPDGQSVSMLSIFGGLKLSTNPVELTASRAILLQYQLDRTASKSVSEKWLNKFIKAMKTESKSFKLAVVDFFAGNISVDNEISASVNKDLYLVGIAIVIFIIVAVICMSKPDKVATRSSLAAIGLLSCVLAMLAGYGLSMAIGLPFTTLQQTLPFILLGVSIDVMIIMSSAFDDIAIQDPSLTTEQRFDLMMRTAGNSVFVTTFASALAFALGTITELPAITYFSAFATLSVACIFVSQVTFFLAIFMMTERRIAANRIDCCCCYTASTTPSSQPPVAVALPDNEAPHMKSMTPVSIVQATSVRKGEESALEKGGSHSGFVSKFVDKYYAPFLLKLPVRIIVVLAFAGFAAFSGWAFTQLKEGQPLEELAPDDSYLIPFIKINRATFDDQLGPSTRLVYRNIDPSFPAIQGKMLSAMNTTLKGNSYFNTTISAFQDNWLMSFINYAASNNVTMDTTSGCFNPYVGDRELQSSLLSTFINPKPLPGCVPRDQFYPLLKTFLADKRYKSFANDIVFNSDGTMKASFFTLYHKASKNKDDFDRKMLVAVRKSESRVNDKIFKSEKSNKGSVFMIYASTYNNGEGLAILKKEVLIYAVLAVSGVGAVVMLMLVNPLAAALMMISVALVDLFLFAEMYIFDLRFNYVSAINMIMATGLAVDYSVYIAHKFMNTEGADRVTRMHTSLTETGSAVFLGALTSLSGTIPLAFSSSTILRTFFALLFGTVIFASFTGMVLMPVLFASIGPPPLQRLITKGCSRMESPV